MRRRSQISDTPEIPIAPMIDCVFLMLVYFMTTSSLERSEADLVFPSGSPGMAADPLAAVDEQLLLLGGDSVVEWNGSRFAVLNRDGFSGLRQRLEGFRQTCSAAGSDPSLQIRPSENAAHQALVSLLDAVTLSGIEAVHLP